MYIDDAIGGNKMTLMLDKLVSSPKFKNTEDIITWFNKSVINSDGSIVDGGRPAKNLLNELDTGIKELNQGKEVIISKIIGGNEIDVLNITDKKIIECKRVTGGESQIKVNINSIIGKFTTETRLSTANKALYPLHTGQLRIDNPSNPYSNLSKQQFIDKVRQDLFPNIEKAGIDKLKLKAVIEELEVINAQGTFKINSNEW
ncbi:hypothetical protein O2K51_08975 [Apibacter raozihei]|uniref:hypothetical protein n=1 Tax=Apibacter raozihei TaxID=2500547 RepID=UPI000FE3307E|nr:hypothetical protein [Apibacter raozihei]